MAGLTGHPGTQKTCDQYEDDSFHLCWNSDISPLT